MNVPVTNKQQISLQLDIVFLKWNIWRVINTSLQLAA